MYLHCSATRKLGILGLITKHLSEMAVFKDHTYFLGLLTSKTRHLLIKTDSKRLAWTQPASACVLPHTCHNSLGEASNNAKTYPGQKNKCAKNLAQQFTKLGG